MGNIKFYYGNEVPLEMHKVRIVPKAKFAPVEEKN